MRLPVAVVQVKNQDRDRFRRVAGSLERLQTYAAKFNEVVVAKRGKRVSCFGRGPQVDCRSHPIAQFQVSGDKIRMKMRQKHVLNLEPVLGRKRGVLFGVSLWINDGGCAGRLVPNQVRSVRQARKIKLLKDHAAPSSFTVRLLGLRNNTQIRPRG